MNSISILLVFYGLLFCNCFKLPQINFTTYPKYINSKKPFTAKCVITNFSHDPIESSLLFYVNSTINGKKLHKVLAIFGHGGKLKLF